MTRIGSILLVAALATLFALPTHAQNIDKAIKDFKRGDYETAAAQFYAVLRLSSEQGDIVEAEYGLAKSFEKLELWLAALKYYEDIAKQGSEHPHFEKAVEGLLNAGDALDDDLKTPQVLDATYNERNGPTLQKMNPEIVQRLNFVVGRVSFNRGNMNEAFDFFRSVKEGNPAYARAQYMLGLLRLGVGRPDQPAPKYKEAVEHFENARTAIPANSTDEALLELRDLCSLAIGRAHYEQAYGIDEGDPRRAEYLRQAMLEYQRVPRFAPAWSEALFERAWTHTVANEYGRALGAMHSLRAPYFKDQFYPEADILKAIIYYYNCQWDRVNAVLTETKSTYEPMVKHLEGILAKDLALDEWYPLVKKSIEQDPAGPVDTKLLPYGVAVSIVGDPKFKKMEAFLTEIDREARLFKQKDAFSKSDMGQEMTDFAADTKEAFLGVVGKLVRSKVSDLRTELSDLTTRASLVALETKTAEADWLEQGRTIDNQQRARLPRPFIPDDTFQFWWFRDEYWVDELGYYEFTIKTECFE